MSDDTMTDTTEAAEGHDDAGTTLVAEHAHAADEPERPTWWNRFLSPLVIPVLVVLGIVLYVLSISRIFLAAEGTLAVIFATLITLAILVGATILANSKMKGSSMAITTMGGLVAIGLLGMVSIGDAEPEKEEVVQLGDPVGTYTLEAGNLFYRPNTATVPVGIIQIDVSDVGTHNITFEPSPNLTFERGAEVVTMPSDGDYSGKVEIKAAGDYVFYCSIPGHRAAGMEGVLTADAAIPPGDVVEGDGTTAPEAGAGGDTMAP